MSANESKRRSEHQPPDTIAFQYKPLEEGIDCTRFLRIHPAKNDNDPIICCTLDHIAFGEKPSYEALSYRWGDEALAQTIVLNGHHFLVRKNLHDALQYLRNRGNVGLVWIDAICIDQANVQERNRQVAIMRHIYFRAHTVVVWLGSTYSQYQKGIGPLEARFAPEDSSVEETLTSATGPSEPDDAHAVSLKSECNMVVRLAKDEYWKRVWIIQEIGHARQRRVCFGKIELSWSDFIKMMTHHSVTTEGPLRLNQQVEQKYQGSHTLRRLLSDHRNSQCQDPKDKIFGLIGLAVDGYGYPSPDYDKSLFQIWTETMEFMNRHKMFDENNELEIVSHANLVKFLLMGTRCTPIQQVLRPYAAEAETQLVSLQYGNIHPGAFTLTGYILGSIQSLGPSVKDVAGNLGKVDEWSHKVQINYEDDLGSACKESNKLLGALLGEQTEEVLQLCSNQLSLVSWEAHSQMNCPLFPFLNWDDRPKHKLVPIESPNHSEPSSHISTKNSGASETLLYQLWTGHRSNQSPRWKMGVASCQAALGDVVCWVGGTKTALVVRPTEGYRSPHQRYVENVQLQVIGTAMVAEDIADSMIDHSLRLNIRGKRGEVRLEYEAKPLGKVSLMLDARTLYVILLENQG